MATLLPKTCEVKSEKWAKVTAPVKAGESYTLTLISHDDGVDRTYNATYWDDVELT